MVEELKKEGLIEVGSIAYYYREKSLYVRNRILFLETKEKSQDSWEGKFCIVFMKPWAEASRENRKLHRDCQHELAQNDRGHRMWIKKMLKMCSGKILSAKMKFKYEESIPQWATLQIDF